MHRVVILGALVFAGFIVAGCASGSNGYDAGARPVDGSARDGGGKPVEGDAGPSCLGEMCGETCVDLQTDVGHCGGCDQACPAGDRCRNGGCELDPCESGRTECDGACVDVLVDVAHCGGCGGACERGEACFGGACGPSSCPAGTSRCGAACVDLSSDAASCGACGTRCASTEECRDGGCVDTCPAPSQRCTVEGSVSCVDVTGDAANCGGCGVACAGIEACTDGVCDCAAPNMRCDGVCTDVTSSHGNCGACGNSCGVEQLCVGGACTCPTGFTLCDGVCTNANIDDRNCGGCGVTCMAPAESCSGGSCVASCGAGMVVCGGHCTDTSTDAAHCGACGNACSLGMSCRAGSCAPVNDDRIHATPLTLGGAEVVVSGTTVGATHDGPSVPCACTSGANVWYSFTLAERSVVYFDTAGSGRDTSLFLTDSAGVALSGQSSAGFPNDGLCNDDARCSGGGFTSIREARVAGVLSAGTYFVAVGGCGQGAFTLRGQVLPDSLGRYFYSSRLQGDGTTSTVLVGVSEQTSTCGGSASGEDLRWILTCGDQPQFFSLCASDGGSFERREGTSTFYDPTLYVLSGQTGGQVACNDDGGSMGGTDCVGTAPPPAMSGDTYPWGSRLNNVSVPRGIAFVVVDERSGGSGMNYTLRYIVR